MKNLITLILLAGLAFMAQSCNLSRSAVVKDTVKALVTTTADYYKFYHPAYGEGRLKDVQHTIRDNQGNPDLPIRIIPSPDKQDAGYFIIKPAAPAEGSTSISPGDQLSSGELVLKQSDFRLIEIPQRGN